MKLGSLHFDYTRKVYSKFQTASYHALLEIDFIDFCHWIQGYDSLCFIIDFSGNFLDLFQLLELSQLFRYHIFLLSRYKLSSGGNAEDDITENSYFLMYVGRLMVKRVLKTRRRRFKNLISSLVSITSLLTSLTVLLLNVKLLHCSSSVFFLFLFFFEVFLYSF